MGNYFAILPLLGAALTTGLGLFTLTRNPRHLANIGFAAGMLSLAIFEVGSAMLLLSGGGGWAMAGMRTSLAGEALLPPAWVLFSIVFGRANSKEMLYRWALGLAGIAAASIFFIFLVVVSPASIAIPVRGSLFEGGFQAFVVGDAGRYFHVYLLVGLVAGLMHLENTLRCSSGSERWRIKYVIFGVGAILGYFVYLSSEALLFGSLSYGAVPLTSSVIVISSAIMAVFIARHRLLHVDIFVSRHVIYNSLTVLVVGVYLIAISAVTYGIQYFKLPFDFFLATLFAFVSILGLVILLFAESLRRKAKLFINRNFYRHKYEFRDKWMETIEKISSKRSAGEITRTLKEMIRGTMGAEPVYLWLYDQASDSYVADGQAPDEALARMPANHPFVGLLKGFAGPFTASDTGGGGDTAVFRESGAALCSPLMAAEEAVGFVLVGPDHTGEPYVEDDRKFLKALTTQAAVQIKNITLVGEIMQAREVEAFSKMSYFIMHDLKNLTNSLSLISQNAKFNMDNPEFQRDAIRTIDGTVDRMKRLIGRLSNVKKDVELRKEWTDLGAFMDGVLKKLAIPKDKSITVKAEFNDTRPVCIDREAIEMIILNLVVNAYEAIPKEGTISIATSSKDGFVSITVSDNGPGIPKDYMSGALFRPFKTTKKSGFGIGLFQCKAVAEAHGGGITVESAEGKGAAFILRLPAGEDFSLNAKISGYNV